MTTSKQNTKPTTQTSSMLKVTAILSIVFGIIGTFFGLWMIQNGLSDPTFKSSSLFGLFVFFIWVLPHAFWVIAGIRLLQPAKKSLIQGLLIAIIILGAIWNIILMAFAIVNLIQLQQDRK